MRIDSYERRIFRMRSHSSFRDKHIMSRNVNLRSWFLEKAYASENYGTILHIFQQGLLNKKDEQEQNTIYLH